MKTPIPSRRLPTRPASPKVNFVYRPKQGPTVSVEKPKAVDINVKGLSAVQLLRSTVKSVKEAAEKDDVRVRSRSASKSGRKVAFVTASAKGSQYKQTVENRDPATTDMRKSRKLIVHCTCDFFKYTCDWVLHQAGASDLESASDDPPDIKNPQRIKTVCKHLFVCLPEL